MTRKRKTVHQQKENIAMLDKTNDLKVIEGDAGKTLPTTWEIGVLAGDLHDALRRVQ